jgi:hypothetical protein
MIVTLLDMILITFSFIEKNNGGIMHRQTYWTYMRMSCIHERLKTLCSRPAAHDYSCHLARTDQLDISSVPS